MSAKTDTHHRVVKEGEEQDHAERPEGGELTATGDAIPGMGRRTGAGKCHGCCPPVACVSALAMPLVYPHGPDPFVALAYSSGGTPKPGPVGVPGGRSKSG